MWRQWVKICGACCLKQNGNFPMRDGNRTGRYLVAEAGIYVCRVLERKESRGQVFLVTDGGLHHHLAASGNFGQVIRKNYPVIVGNKVHGATKGKLSRWWGRSARHWIYWRIKWK